MSKRLIMLFAADVFNRNKKIQSELYCEFYRLVYDMVFHMLKDHATTEDIIQEAFIKVLKKPPQYIDESKVNGWIRTLTKNTALNYLRKNKKKVRDELRSKTVYWLEEVAATNDTHTLTVEQQVEDKMSLEALVQTIRKLKPHYGYVLELKYVHDLTYKEISELLVVTEGTVRQRLARAREAAKNILQNDWEA